MMTNFQKGFLTILETFKKETEPLFVKISPQVVFEKQVYYLKQAKDADCQATIVSEIITLRLSDWLFIAMFRFKQVKKTSERPFQTCGKRKRRKVPTSLWKRWFG